jgi:large subunit ribosomal protein L9
MKVILLKEVKGLGRIGEIKEVSPGYARNFLIPKGLAEVVTKHSLNIFEAQAKKRERLAKQEIKKKKNLATRIKEKKFEIKAKTDDSGTLYAKLDAKAIAKELQKQKYKIEPEEIKLKEVIKKAGEYQVGLELEGKKSKIKLIVISNI